MQAFSQGWMDDGDNDDYDDDNDGDSGGGGAGHKNNNNNDNDNDNDYDDRSNNVICNTSIMITVGLNQIKPKLLRA
jgi:hypothetical protein